MTDPRGALESGLAGRYTIGREIGRGGMATVYLAEDLKHHRQVAIKVLLPELAASLGNERFQREIDLAARLQHPHILSVYDSGEIEGLLWFSMPYVEGESLRDRLNRERQLPVDDALSIAQEAARALEYAHQHGVIHRDIKPENIMLTKDGSTLVADFGIARSLASDAQLTGTGVSIGTPAYMSPEQASGDRQLDARTDIFSLAAVLYEMLAGEAPWTGATAQVIIAKRFSEPAPSVRRVRSSVPVAVDQVLQKAMAAAPADRPPTAGQFAQELKRAISNTTSAATVSMPLAARPSRMPLFAAAAAILVIALSAVGWNLMHKEKGGGSADAGANEPIRIAVLPFDNLGDTSDAYFADGMTDAVRSKLTQLKGMQVIARASSDAYRGSTKTQREIAEELGVQYLLVGTVRWAKAKDGTSRVQVTPELVELGDGAAHSRWAKPFDQPLTEVFAVQGEIATRLAGELDVAIGASAAQEIAVQPTKDLVAYQHYLRGLALTGLDPVGLRQRIEWFRRAVERDSTFGIAWARMAISTITLEANSGASISRDSLRAAIRHAAAQARKYDPTAAETYSVEISLLADAGDDAGVARKGEEAIQRYPNVAGLRRAVGISLWRLGKLDDAITNLRLATQLDPLAIGNARALSNVYFAQGDATAFKLEARRALDMVPDDFASLLAAAESYLIDSDLDGARRLILQVPPSVNRVQLYNYLATYDDLYWLLTPAQQDTVLSSPAGTLDDDRASWALVKAQIYRLRRNEVLTRVWADSAGRAFEKQDISRDAQLQALHALALVLEGRKSEGVTAAKGALRVPTLDTQFNDYVSYLVLRTLTLGGDTTAALDMLEHPRSHSLWFAPRRLRLDPDLEPLRNDPRFRKLVGEK